MDLPPIDRHRITVEASGERVWAALRSYVDGTLAGGDITLLHRILRTEPAAGFEVVDEVPGERVTLSGRHRFSRYRLVFEVTSTGGTPSSTLSATTYAAFPGPAGRVYRLLVLGSRAHALAVRRMLRTVRDQAVGT